MARQRHARFAWGRRRATMRIAWDLVRSLLRPPRVAAAETPPASACTLVAGRARTAIRDEPLRLLMWNIHRAYDARGVTTGLCSLVADHRPHLLLLQELPIDHVGPLWERPELVSCVADCDLAWAPMHRVMAPSAYYPFVESGQLTASRLPIEAARAVALPQVSRAKLGRRHRVCRVALITRHLAADPFTLVHLHLENTARPSGRALQMQTALAAVAGEPRVILAGDLNTAMSGLETAAQEAASRGFREVVLGRRLLPLDRVFVRGFTPTRGRVLGMAGSDHRPVLVELQSR